ncbi:MAG: hypothetical protein GY859_16830 [Desulfobacterales bacterium]|nr:hypothetical protein [Desulfobacterales bacterium]
MAPFLLGGEIVTIKKAPLSSFRRGDLVFFKNNQGFLTLHRLIGKRKDMAVIRTKGDALASPDEPVEKERILGKVYKIETIDPLFGSGNINMESIRWKAINYLIALIHLAIIGMNFAPFLFRVRFRFNQDALTTKERRLTIKSRRASEDRDGKSMRSLGRTRV